jgi:HD-like signal output (HDOD) protein
MDSPNREQLAAETRRRLEGIHDIPTLPPVLLQVWDLTSREDASAEDLARAMSGDPGLTGAILRLANSAYFGFPRKVGTVKQAVVVLGFETVRSLATGASVFRALGAGKQGGLDAAEFFRHSLVTAMGTRLLVEKRWPQLAGSAFCAGILHDLGKLVVAEFLPWSGAGIRSRLDNGAPLEVAEAEELGMSHAEIGAWFAARWNFPSELAAAVRWHHEPAMAEEHADFASAVHVADVLAHRAGAGGSGRTKPPRPDEAALRAVGLGEEALDDWTERITALSVEAPSPTATLGVESR